MPWDREHGCTTPGTNGRGAHLDDPLTVDQIRELPDGAEVVITWSGDNGPWPYRILVNQTGERHVESLHCDPILQPWPPGEQVKPLHRITLGWDDDTRAWHDGKVGEPARIQEKRRLLRCRQEAQP